ncbi:hypothetical protein AB1K62_13165 [Parasphingorhabdus sp. JC815]|uniref:hypothetical protein n=1 Tax=Parasphingorhabdus sp. JC815 TaxID=3232140 RepID=UPI00345A2036
MIDNFSIALTHGLLFIAVWRLIQRPDLDHEDPPEPDQPSGGFYSQRGESRTNGPEQTPESHHA